MFALLVVVPGAHANEEPLPVTVAAPVNVVPTDELRVKVYVYMAKNGFQDEWDKVADQRKR